MQAMRPSRGAPTGDTGMSRAGRQTEDGAGRSDQGWSLTSAAAGDDVQIRLGLPDVAGAPVTAILTLSRPEARAFARSLLAAAGDATERAFSHLPENED